MLRHERRKSRFGKTFPTMSSPFEDEPRVSVMSNQYRASVRSIESSPGECYGALIGLYEVKRESKPNTTNGRPFASPSSSDFDGRSKSELNGGKWSLRLIHDIANETASKEGSSPSFSFLVECGSRALGVPYRYIERISRISCEICLYMYICISMCVLNVLICDQCANLCAKWNIYTRQWDTSKQRVYSVPRYLDKREQHSV